MGGELSPGRRTALAAGIARIVAPNPGMMTGPGTNTYILGGRDLAVIDPGPAIPVHLDAIRRAAAAPIRWILVTHTHPDHSPGAAPLAAACGARLIGLPPPGSGPQDRTFTPDRAPHDGETIEAGDFTLEAVHTPGHASNHVCYRHRESGWLFTGDHIIDGSTVVIDPPDGNMSDYLASLARLRRLDCPVLAPGHGDVIRDTRAAIDRLVQHRLEREAKAAAAVSARSGASLAELVEVVYADVEASRHALAARSLLAHLEKLEAEARVERLDDRWWPRAID